MSDQSFGRDILGDPASAATREWLVTNGIGGYAAGTASGELTRRYHGLLIAALRPPLGRTLLLAKLSERLESGGRFWDLDTNRWESGAVEPRGCVHLESFALEQGVPVWTWAIGDVRLEKRVWMELGENTTYVQYRLPSSNGPVTLHLMALADARDAHGLRERGEGHGSVEPATGGLRIQLDESIAPLWLFAPGAELSVAPEWHRGFALEREAERGLSAAEDHLMVGEFRVRLEPGESFTLIASTRHDVARGNAGLVALAGALLRRRAQEKGLLDAWRRAQPAAAKIAPDWVRQLVLAADGFLVERPTPADPNARTILAGYPWFSDWGRDAMIALPGLALTTGRPELARSILLNFARHADRGMLPNYFPESGAAPEYNTVDAALWLFQAVRAYLEATDDAVFLAEIFPVLEDIGAWYERGTRYGIGVDPRDGLVRAGEAGLALTWMDAKVDEVSVTPRIGKPVEINALWYNALTAMAGFARRLKLAPENYEALARRAEHSFSRFWNAETGALHDVIDGPRGADPSMRPNQIFAVSLPDSPLPAAQRRAVVAACGKWLLTSHGLRTLASDSPEYRGRYAGDPRLRDGAYHQGTAWTWLLPHYALAHLRVHGDRAAALELLQPLSQLARAAALGWLPEIADGDPPHTPRGCVAQAWSVAEALRAWHQIAVEPAPARRPAEAGATRASAPATRRAATAPTPVPATESPAPAPSRVTEAASTPASPAVSATGAAPVTPAASAPEGPRSA